jgi:hypothetical protein
MKRAQSEPLKIFPCNTPSTFDPRPKLANQVQARTPAVALKLPIRPQALVWIEVAGLNDRFVSF